MRSSHAGADTHDRAAQDHQPHWDDHACDTGLPAAKRHAEEQDADEFLAILRAVHETHGRGPDDLRIREEYVGAPAVKPRADQRHQLAHDPADAKSEQEAGRETIQHFDPLPMLMPPMPSWMAMAAPKKPAIRLWLSDVGMPSSDAPTL